MPATLAPNAAAHDRSSSRPTSESSSTQAALSPRVSSESRDLDDVWTFERQARPLVAVPTTVSVPYSVGMQFGRSISGGVRRRLDRRRFLIAGAGATAAVVAGCSSDDSGTDRRRQHPARQLDDETSMADTVPTDSTAPRTQRRCGSPARPRLARPDGRGRLPDPRRRVPRLRHRRRAPDEPDRHRRPPRPRRCATPTTRGTSTTSPSSRWRTCSSRSTTGRTPATSS